jgi:hypothetical protein
MALDPVTAVLDIGSKVIDKVWPDKQAADAAKLELYRLQQAGQLDEMKTQLSAIIADAQSTDPYTSRARPSFLYVVYVLILWAIPMGILTIFSPQAAAAFTAGFRAWLSAIPQEILQLFGVVMTGYVLGRSWEKVKGASK